MMHDHDTIVAPATAPGGALAVVRLSGTDAIALCDRFFRGSAPLAEAQGHTVHYGRIVDAPRTIDDVLVSVFRAPHSYTGEDSVEISCHGSSYIVSEILRLAQAAGARMAQPGEFTVRAYLAGKLDLSQAEAVADLIASSSQAAHALAANQMRGGYSAALETLREKLLRLVSLLELELDFSEEDVEFADREELTTTIRQLGSEIDALRRSFSLGNAIKEGVSVAIVGAPNAGKSTLLNRLLHDDRAMVSEIAGTTRDVIEERINIDGVVFRFLDTAGLRPTDDRLERMGIRRTLDSIRRARIIIHLISAETIGNPAAAIPSTGNTGLDEAIESATSSARDFSTLGSFAPDFPVRDDQILLTVINKIDTRPELFAKIPTTDTPKKAATAGSDRAADDFAAPPISEGFGNTAVCPSDLSMHAVGASTARNTDDFSAHTSNADTTHTDIPRSEDSKAADLFSHSVFAISARDGRGVDSLCRALRNCIDTRAIDLGSAVVSHSRHFQALSDARQALDRAAAGLDSLPTDLLSEEIRTVITAIGSITGRGTITPDEILSNIFSKFCIGK